MPKILLRKLLVFNNFYVFLLYLLVISAQISKTKEYMFHFDTLLSFY